MNKENSVSEDTLFDGDLVCQQNIDGYRFSVDSILLAHFIKPKVNDSILDLGTGCGIILLLLQYRWRGVIKKTTGIELQSSLAALANKNISKNHFGPTANIIEGDIKKILSLVRPESYQIVISNPPFYLPETGRMNVNKEATQARHQILGGLNDFLEAAAAAVINRGSVYFIYPAERIGEFISLARKRRLEVKKLQFVYSYPDTTKSAKLVLIQCIKNGGLQAEIMPPFYIYDSKNGLYTKAMQQCYAVNSE